MTITKPKIKKYLEEIKLNIKLVSEDLVDFLIIDQVIDFQIKDIEINGCKFIGCDFSKYSLKNVNLIDCVFEKCNLSNSEFYEKSIHRTIFDNCNMVGCDFVSSSFYDISILESKCNYINFSDSNIKRFCFKNSVAKNGRFVFVKFIDVAFDYVNFDECEFLNTKLVGLDFSNCSIINIGISSDVIKGMIVNEEQAIMLISLFGIMVK